MGFLVSNVQQFVIIVELLTVALDGGVVFFQDSAVEVAVDVHGQIAANAYVVFHSEMPPLPVGPTEGELVRVAVVDACSPEGDP